MKRYKMWLVVRPNPDCWSANECELGEHHVKCNYTAPNEVEARRAALEVAYCNGLLVSGFTSISEVEV